MKLLRKLFILGVVVVFVAYCSAAYKYSAQVDVPGYVTADVNLLGDKTPAAWKADKTYQAHRLMQMEHMKYHPLPPEGLKLSDGTVFPAGHPLKEKDFQKIVADALARGDMKVKLLDPTALYSLAHHNYAIRDRIVASDGSVLLEGGETLNKANLDKLIDARIARVGITGKGEPVKLQPATMAMIWLIFLALVAALKDMLWDPVLAIIQSRKKEIDDGAALARANSTENTRLDKERLALLGEANRAYHDRLSAVRREAMVEAEAILKKANAEEKAIRDQAMAELDSSLKAARAELKKQLPEMARSAVTQVLGRSVA